MKNIFAITWVVSATIVATESLSCLPCPLLQQTCLPVYRLGCKGGLTTDICGCCAVCAKVSGERCGRGIFIQEGKCDCGLKCKRPNVNVEGICGPK